MIDRDFISWFEKQKCPQSFEDFKKENQMKYVIQSRPLSDEQLYEIWKRQELIKKERRVKEKIEELKKDFE